jgi:hypothetical protein
MDKHKLAYAYEVKNPLKGQIFNDYTYMKLLAQSSL